MTRLCSYCSVVYGYKCDHCAACHVTPGQPCPFCGHVVSDVRSHGACEACYAREMGKLKNHPKFTLAIDRL